MSFERRIGQNTTGNAPLEAENREQEITLPAWNEALKEDFDEVMAMRLRVIRQAIERSPNDVAIQDRYKQAEEFGRSASIEMQLIMVMNNFRLYLPGFPEDSMAVRSNVALLEQGGENDERIQQVIDEKKKIFAAIDNVITVLGISDEDLEKMRNHVKIDKKTPEFPRIMKLMGDLFYTLRAQGYSMKDLST